MTWFFSVLLRIFTLKPLALWRQMASMAFESFANPLLSQLTMLAESGTFLDGSHSYRAFLIETPHLRFRTNTHLGRNRRMSLGVLTVKGRDPSGAVMFARATPVGGNSAGSSLESEGFLAPKFKGSACSPGLIRPSALPWPARPGSVQLMRYDTYILVIYQFYISSE